jgi:hypothetical protein
VIAEEFQSNTLELISKMRFGNFLQPRSLASKAFLVLFVINQIVVLNVIFKKFTIYAKTNQNEQTAFVETLANDKVESALLNTTTELATTTTTDSITTKTDSSTTTTPRYTMVNDREPRNDSKIYILFFNGCFNLPYWSLGKETLDESDLKSVNCPHTNCVLTHKYGLLENIHDYDAIIFNVWYPNDTLPLTRSPHQQYIMAANE